MPTRNTKLESRMPKRASFDYSLDFKTIHFRRRQELCRIGTSLRALQGSFEYNSDVQFGFEYFD